MFVFLNRKKKKTIKFRLDSHFQVFLFFTFTARWQYSNSTFQSLIYLQLIKCQENTDETY